MSMNPFDGQLLSGGNALAILDRDSDLLDLDSKYTDWNTLSYRYTSPRGTGKTTLLTAYFTDAKCRELAEQYKKLVSFCAISGDQIPTDADIFVKLIEAVKESLENLDSNSDDYRILMDDLAKKEAECGSYTADCNKGEALLKRMLTCLKRRNYHVILVLDDFHDLACAKSLAMATFSKMAAIANNPKKFLSYLIVSDYDDKVGAENYYISPFTRIFTTATTHLSGVTTERGKQALIDLVHKKTESYPNVHFSDDELRAILHMTGGIPGLMQLALKDIFNIKCSTSGELSPEKMEECILLACRPHLDKWVQYFDDNRWETMLAVIEDVTESAISNRLSKDVDERTALGEAGLIFKDLVSQKYRTICPLFTTYILQENRRRRPGISPVSSVVPKEIVPASEGRVIINVGTGATVYHGDNHIQHVHIDNLSAHQGLSVVQMLDLIDRAVTREQLATSLTEQLKGCLLSGRIEPLVPDDRMSQEEYEHHCDEEFHRYGQQIIRDMDVEGEVPLEVTPAAWKTLDARFAEARSRCRTGLSDEVLAAQSERCQFYLKLSVVVEDALALPGLQMGDFSPQLVLYGKALEQTLRDNFYMLFHTEPELSVYDTYCRKPNPKSGNVFANFKNADRTYIGNYRHLILGKRKYLSQLCGKHCIGEADTWDWWNRFQDDVNSARNIRNMAGHADPSRSPNLENLNEMCNLLIGTDCQKGILSRALIGTVLTQKLSVRQSE